MYKSIYKQTFTHTCVEFDSMHFGAGCLGRMWPYYPKLWQIFSVDFRGIFLYFRYIGVSSYCSHRDHCVHADQQSDQTLSASGISQLKSNEAIVLVKKQNEAIVLVIKIKPSEALSLLKQYKRTRHSLCLLTINVISNAKEYKRTDGPTSLPVDKLQYINLYSPILFKYYLQRLNEAAVLVKNKGFLQTTGRTLL